MTYPRRRLLASMMAAAILCQGALRAAAAEEVAGEELQFASQLVKWGQLKAEQADKPAKTKEEREALRAEARQLCGEALKAFRALEKRFLDEHGKFPKLIDPNDAEKIEARNHVRRNLLQVRLALPTVRYEIAHTYDPDAEGRTKNLNESAEQYHELYEKYGSWLGGLYARMWEGRCYKELGKTKEAFEAFEEVLTLPDEPQAFRMLKNKAAVLALETALLPKVKKYEEAVATYRAWERTARPDEEASPEGLAIRYLSGEAALRYAKVLREEEPEKIQSRQEHEELAHRLFSSVAQFPGEYQQAAKTLLDNLPL